MQSPGTTKDWLPRVNCVYIRPQRPITISSNGLLDWKGRHATAITSGLLVITLTSGTNFSFPVCVRRLWRSYRWIFASLNYCFTSRVLQKITNFAFKLGIKVQIREDRDTTITLSKKIGVYWRTDHLHYACHRPSHLTSNFLSYVTINTRHHAVRSWLEAPAATGRITILICACLPTVTSPSQLFQPLFKRFEVSDEFSNTRCVPGKHPQFQ